MLYETISLHALREDELICCLRTLCDPRGSRKAQLIQTFAITYADSYSIPIAVRSVGYALQNMTSLKVLSVWGPEQFDTEVEEAIRCAFVQLVNAGSVGLKTHSLHRSHLPNIRRVYLSNLKEFEPLLKSRHSLEVVGLWFNSNDETEKDSIGEMRLRRPLALRRLSREPFSPSQSNKESQSDGSGLDPNPRGEGFTPDPWVISIEYREHYYGDTALRTLTIHECPFTGKRTLDTPSFVEFPAKNGPAHDQIHQDLLLDFPQDYDLDRTNAIRVVLRDFSPQSLMWAHKVVLSTLEKYPDSRGPLVERPMVQLSIIRPPKRPFNLVRVHPLSHAAPVVC
jgi:hypothetical protein